MSPPKGITTTKDDTPPLELPKTESIPLEPSTGLNTTAHPIPEQQDLSLEQMPTNEVDLPHIVTAKNKGYSDELECDSQREAHEYKKPVSGKTGKEAATDVPSWAKGQKPYVGESGKEFARRLMDEKYGPGNYPKGPGSEFNKLHKWGDRGFQ